MDGNVNWKITHEWSGLKIEGSIHDIYIRGKIRIGLLNWIELTPAKNYSLNNDLMCLDLQFHTSRNKFCWPSRQILKTITRSQKLQTKIGIEIISAKDLPNREIIGVNKDYHNFGFLEAAKAVKISQSQPPRPQSKEIQNSNLYVTHIPMTWDNDRLRQVFSQFGYVVECRILVDPDSKSRGVGFVRMDNHVNALKAIEATRGYRIDGETELVVKKTQWEKQEKEIAMMACVCSPFCSWHKKKSNQLGNE
ncbi:hypothetical protein RFI_31022 [Reticulomyxa filosa]|uniref:RRM domain-containing protein n=1 Tax=Reticulomyxa filosa TaxID=46433 RepID=X6LWU5_RETFI|nr:hypothetical protein RFI_31022 [Reticulomyxa filosa]|eukprot:ETO06373.1 hypothetical protein RFI_31022 [Reticulomyxa filosa]